MTKWIADVGVLYTDGTWTHHSVVITPDDLMTIDLLTGPLDWALVYMICINKLKDRTWFGNVVSHGFALLDYYKEIDASNQVDSSVG